MRKFYLLLPILFFSSLTVFAKNADDSTKLLIDYLKKRDSIEKSLHYKTGKIVLGNNIATIHVPEGFKFLDAAEAKYVLEDVWHNLKGQSPLGILFPPGNTATYPPDYVFIIEYDDIGYVKDGDADKINYDDLLKDIQKGQVEANVERKKQGIATMDLIGWAAKPYYDKQRKLLYWAKEFKVEGDSINTLNYDIRVLGRKGVLTMEALAEMPALDSVNKNIDTVLAMVSFNDGNKYSDFDSKSDKIAAWTIGGLVAGKILAKVGFLAIILKFLKFIILGIVAAGGAVWRFITGRKKKEEEFVYQPQPAPTDNPTEQ